MHRNVFLRVGFYAALLNIHLIYCAVWKIETYCTTEELSQTSLEFVARPGTAHRAWTPRARQASPFRWNLFRDLCLTTRHDATFSSTSPRIIFSILLFLQQTFTFNSVNEIFRVFNSSHNSITSAIQWRPFNLFFFFFFFYCCRPGSPIQCTIQEDKDFNEHLNVLRIGVEGSCRTGVRYGTRKIHNWTTLVSNEAPAAEGTQDALDVYGHQLFRRPADANGQARLTSPTTPWRWRGRTEAALFKNKYTYLFFEYWILHVDMGRLN